MPRRRWDLPKGRFVILQAGTWYLYDRPGHLLYSGDAEGLEGWLLRLGVTLPNA